MHLSEAVTIPRSLPATSVERQNPNAFITPDASRLLNYLSQLQKIAKATNYPPDQFSVPYQELLSSLEITSTDLRILVASGSVIHLQEKNSSSRLESRILQPSSSLAFGHRSCFSIGKIDPELLGTDVDCVSDSMVKIKPFWDRDARKLWYRDQLVKHFRCPARSQETVLCVFEEEAWSERIYDPLPGQYGTRMKEVIRGLNRSQIHELLRFRSVCNGQKISWEPRECPSPAT